MIMKITVNAVKTFIGREGHGYNCNVFVDGAKVAFARDSASGGESDYDYVGKDQETRQANCSLLVKAIKEYPPLRIEDDKDGFTAIYDKDGNWYQGIDSIIGGLVDGFLYNKKLKAKLKKSVCFTDSTSDNGSYYYSIPHNGNIADCKSHIINKYKCVSFLTAE
jgi:hypothetical protein